MSWFELERVWYGPVLHFRKIRTIKRVWKRHNRFCFSNRQIRACVETVDVELFTSTSRPIQNYELNFFVGIHFVFYKNTSLRLRRKNCKPLKAKSGPQDVPRAGLVSILIRRLCLKRRKKKHRIHRNLSASHNNRFERFKRKIPKSKTLRNEFRSSAKHGTQLSDFKCFPFIRPYSVEGEKKRA